MSGSDAMMAARRDLLKLGAGGATLAALPSGLLAGQTAAYPPDVGRKFYADGRVHPFAGCTVICHLPQQGDNAACFNAMLDLFREAPSHPLLRKVALLPPSSYHMTVFGGANDTGRKMGSWPADLPLDMPFATCLEIMSNRLRSFDAKLVLPIRMKIDPVQRPENGQALIFRLQPYDEAERAKLKDVRDRLADVLQLRTPDQDSYQFHMSFGYQVAWFSPAEMLELGQLWQSWAKRIAAQSPDIFLGAPEFCSFEDMFAFHRLQYLGTQSAAAGA